MNRCITGDCLDVLPTIDVDSIDACVTDPPYGIGFMGREWDTFKPGTHSERKLPQWNGGQKQNPNLNGRSRSPAISPSQIEYDRSLRGQRGFQDWTEQWAREVLRVLKPGAHLLVCGAPRSYHRMACAVEDAGFEIRDCIMWVFGQGFPKSHNLDGDWDGWGTALKPAWEPIIVARKPLIGTVAENMLLHGAGAINIDGCRITTLEALQGSTVRNDMRGGKFAAGHKPNPGDIADYEQNTLGRWPANVVHDGSDEVLEAFPDAPGQIADISNAAPSAKTSNVYGAMRRAGEPSQQRTYTDEGGTNFAMKPGARRLDTGSAARFFYCAKTSRVDRNEGCELFDAKPLNWSSGAQSPGTFQSEGTDKTSPNNHPTVKPTSLMRYLVRLVTAPGGTVLDPFMGSGSTGKACTYEGFNFVGIEREADYARIAEARIAFAAQDHFERTAQHGFEFA